MRHTLGQQGDWVVDPCELAPRLGVDADYLKRMERQGHVDARIKIDDDSGTGQTRVTVRLLNRGWRGTFHGGGALICEEMW
ncbi:DUF6522 family protein [Methylobacterium sp. 285MFTsu5.1]|uniref:DUF6522 family protein n=1 Tax=Methylobacterium sp. 285MFTsu5.1 TaxID=1172187 RepID=UPI00037E8B61|nr:DUF6522 family protein [Methylobacterium sp. 285MFTsu5.1]